MLLGTFMRIFWDISLLGTFILSDVCLAFFPYHISMVYVLGWTCHSFQVCFSTLCCIFSWNKSLYCVECHHQFHLCPPYFLIFINCHIVLVTPDYRKLLTECTGLVVFRYTSPAVKWCDVHPTWCTFSFCAYTLQVLFKVVALLPSVLWCLLAAQMSCSHAFVCPPCCEWVSCSCKKKKKSWTKLCTHS